MNSTDRITYDNFAAFLRGEESSGLRKAVAGLRESEPAYHLLLELLEELRGRVAPAPKRGARPAAGFDEVESLLLYAYSGEKDLEKDRRFVDLFLRSPDFYQRLIVKLAQVAADVIPEAAPQTAQEWAPLHSDQELISRIVSPRYSRQQPGNLEKLVATIGEQLGRLAGAFRPLPRRIIAIPVVLATVLLLLVMWPTSDPYSPYQWQKQVPYDFSASALTGSGLRSAAPAAGTAALPALNESLDRLQEIFKLSLGSYLTRDYAAAVRTLKRQESEIDELRSRIGEYSRDTAPQEAARAVQLLEEYDFYAGTTYLAYAHSTALKDSARTAALSKAVENLRHAQALVGEYQLETGGREHFFAGLALGLSGEKEAARAELHRVSPESPYFQEAQELIEKIGQ